MTYDHIEYSKLHSLLDQAVAEEENRIASCSYDNFNNMPYSGLTKTGELLVLVVDNPPRPRHLNPRTHTAPRSA